MFGENYINLPIDGWLKVSHWLLDPLPSVDMLAVKPKAPAQVDTHNLLIDRNYHLGLPRVSVSAFDQIWEHCLTLSSRQVEVVPLPRPSSGICDGHCMVIRGFIHDHGKH